MAVAQMMKFQLLGYAPHKEKVINSLIDTGAVHIANAKAMLEQSDCSDLIRDINISIVDWEEKLSLLHYIIDFTATYYEKPRGLAGMLRSKLKLTAKELNSIVQNHNIHEMYQQAIDLENQKKKLLLHKDKNFSLIKEITPWLQLSIPLEEITETESVYLRLGIMKSDQLAKAKDAVFGITNEFDIIPINATKSLTYFVLACIKIHFIKVLEIIKEFEGRIVEFEAITGLPSEAIRQLEQEISQLGSQLIKLEEDSREFTAKNREIALILHDYTSEQLHKLQVQENFAHTSETFFIEGWLRQRDEKLIKQKLIQISPAIEIITTNPEPHEKPPIALENAGYVTPFEFITTLYSRPDYREFDPTPLMAPFFILFFGLCLSDGGYGLILAALAGWALKKLKPEAGTAGLFKVMVYGGIVTFFVGAFTGGWFGLEMGGFPSIFRKMVLVNPLENPMAMLKLAFILGIVQILFGIGIKGYRNFKSGDITSAILDQGLWIITLIFLVPLGYGFILGGEIPSTLSAVASKGVQVCLVGLILTQGRHQKGPVKKLFAGILKLYDIVGYFGDVLSYARLLALGLATSAIAMAINGVAKITLSMPYGIGYIIFALIFICGHIFNLAVNTLGGFVHSSRLQFLEYFSKFFIGGGSEFKPFQKRAKYSVVLED